MRTSQTIIDSFTARVTERESIAPDEWMQASMFLNVLIGEEKAKLFEAEQEYNKSVIKWIELEKSHAEAEKRAKAEDVWLAYKKQDAFVKQIESFILLAKKQATLAIEMGG